MLLGSAIWIYFGIQSPFLIFCFYGVLRRVSWIASPKIVIAAFLSVCIGFYLFFYEVDPFAGDYSHFLFAAIFLIVGYCALVFRFRYDRVDALVLSALTMIAIDELWQTPFNAINWTSGLYQFELGFVTAGWNLQSIPFIFYFLLKINANVKLNRNVKLILLLCLCLTVFETWRFYIGGYPDNSNPVSYPGIEPYYLVIPWFVFFLALFRSSRSCADRATNAGDRSRPGTA